MVNPSREEIKDFYNEFEETQSKRGVNLRILNIFRHLRRAGLKRDHQVLEIGCGIGTVTGLIGKYVRQGSVLGVDISPKCIATAQKTLGHMSHVEFRVSDMQDFTSDSLFDVIVLPDVLEHIPMEQHAALFNTMHKVLKPDGVVVIHIPDPRFLEWTHKEEPQKLQILDQPLHSDFVVNNAYKAGFYLGQLRSYKVFYDTPDYQLITLYPQKPVQKAHLQGKYILALKTLWARFTYLW